MENTMPAVPNADGLAGPELYQLRRKALEICRQRHKGKPVPGMLLRPVRGLQDLPNERRKKR